MTKRFYTIIVALGLVAVAFSQSTAFDTKVSDVTLLTVDAVKKELAITQAQRDTMNLAADQYNRMSKLMYEKANKGIKPTDAELSSLAKVRDTMRTKVLAVLTPAQLKRLREITLQDAGMIAIAQTDVAKELGLNSAQVTKIRNLLKTGMEKSQKLMQDAQLRVEREFANRKPKTDAEKRKLEQEVNARIKQEVDKVKPQVDKVEADTGKAVMAAMSAAQRQKWINMLGRPFNPPRS